eukprot:360488-Chlamydomonas_euryale.AAC.8
MAPRQTATSPSGEELPHIVHGHEGCTSCSTSVHAAAHPVRRAAQDALGLGATYDLAYLPITFSTSSANGMHTSHTKLRADSIAAWQPPI